jgi:hypothetical protein
MRIREVIVEDVYDSMIQDEANDPVINTLLTHLVRIHERASETHTIPKVMAKSLINLVRTEHPQFNFDTLKMAKGNNDAVGQIISDIKEDESGTMWVYIAPYQDEQDTPGIDDNMAPRTAPEKTVNSMAKSALAKRS